MRFNDVELVDESGAIVPVTDVVIDDEECSFAGKTGRPVTAHTDRMVGGYPGSLMTIRRCVSGEVLGTFILGGVGTSLVNGVRSVICGMQLLELIG